MDTLQSNKNLAKSKEMITFYRQLAAVQTNAILLVMQGNNDDEKKKIAVKETRRLSKLYNDKCPVGTVRNPITGDCE
jgi:hypothetical protein